MHSLFPQAFYRHTILMMTLATTLLLTGCGFHLKENNGLVEKCPEVYLQTSDPKSDLTRLMKLR